MVLQEYISAYEYATGKQLKLTDVSAEELQKRMDPNPTGPIVNFFLELMVEIARAQPRDFVPNLNALCPSVKQMKVEEFLKTWWGESEM